jgi:hypothetical protein
MAKQRERERMQLTRDHVPSLCLEYTATAACEYYHMKYTHHTQRVREHTQPERERDTKRGIGSEGWKKRHASTAAEFSMQKYAFWGGIDRSISCYGNAQRVGSRIRMNNENAREWSRCGGLEVEQMRTALLW